MEPKPVVQDPTRKINTTISNIGTAASQAAAVAEEKATEVKDAIQNKGSEILDATKQTVSEAYDKTSRTVAENYQRAMDFGRENPGTATLIALGAGLGAGIGLGVLLASNHSSRTRASRVVPPVLNALTTLAYDLFRR